MMFDYVNLNYKPKKEIICEYYLEPNKISLEKAADDIAAESSIGTWTKVDMQNKVFKNLHPNVFYIDKKRRIIRIAYNLDLFEKGNIAQLLSAVAGNIFGMKSVKNLRLLDITFPQEYINSFKGPKFGIQGIRKLLRVNKRPLAGTIIKPKVGLNEKEHAKKAYEAWIGGLDLVKDDENLTNLKFNNFKKRVIETLKIREKAEKKTGERKMYLANITAEPLEMLRRAKFVKENNGEYVMLDILTSGFGSLQTLRNEDLNLVIHGHRAMHAALTRNKKHGISMLFLAKISRLIGVDQLHIGTLGLGKMDSSKEVLDIEEEIEDNIIIKNNLVLQQEWYNIKNVFAVASGGLHPAILPDLIDKMGLDLIVQFGGGCHGHRDGTVSGARAIKQALDAYMKNISLKDYSKQHKELRVALEQWNRKLFKE